MLEDVPNQLQKTCIGREESFMEIDIRRMVVVLLAQKKKKVHDSRSHKKVIDIPTEFPKESIEGYRIIDMGILRDITNNLNCPGCNSKNLLLFENTQKKKKGLPSYLSVKCCICGFVINRYTSFVLPNDDKRDHRGMKTYDLNARSVYALRSCVVGHTGLEKICGLMNLPNQLPATIMIIFLTVLEMLLSL